MMSSFSINPEMYHLYKKICHERHVFSLIRKNNHHKKIDFQRIQKRQLKDRYRHTCYRKNVGIWPYRSEFIIPRYSLVLYRTVYRTMWHDIAGGCSRWWWSAHPQPFLKESWWIGGSKACPNSVQRLVTWWIYRKVGASRVAIFDTRGPGRAPGPPC